MVLVRSATKLKLFWARTLRSRTDKRTENQVSMRLSHGAEAGVKCRCRAFSPRMREPGLHGLGFVR